MVIEKIILKISDVCAEIKRRLNIIYITDNLNNLSFDEKAPETFNLSPSVNNINNKYRVPCA